jgi:gamma-glutamyltranspeptidase / glutathione hydrolase
MNPSFTTRPELKGTFGMVASTDWIASGAAMGVLERGGNAFDAAVAGGFVLQVVEPHLNGPGGEVPAILWEEGKQRCRVLCGIGVAPAGATISAYRRLGFGLVPGTGLLAACVPGAFDAWMRLLAECGTIGLRAALEPAIHYAEHGYPLLPRIVQALHAVRDLFLNEWPTSAQVYLKGGRVPAPGSLFRNPVLAQTYKRLVTEAERHGPDRVGEIEAARRIWREGFVAKAIGEFAAQNALLDTSGDRHRGVITADDIASWESGFEEPLLCDLGRHSIAKCGAWSQGPVMLQVLQLLRASGIEGVDPMSERFVHTLVEAFKLAFADREAWLGDPKFADIPLASLLSPEYAAARRALMGERASMDLRPGSPDGRVAQLPDYARLREEAVSKGFSTGVGEPTFADLAPEDLVHGDTCHIDVVDRWGNMITATPSGGWLSSSPVIPALGFSLNTRLQVFWLDEGLPNSLVPGKRPRVTLSPTLALRDGEPWLAFGTPGGDQQEQWQTAFFLRVALHGMNLQEAIDAPAWHSHHSVSSFWPRTAEFGKLTLEGRWPKEIADALRARGHEVVVGEPWSEGRLTAVARERAGHSDRSWLLKAGANPRGMQGYAVGR